MLQGITRFLPPQKFSEGINPSFNRVSGGPYLAADEIVATTARFFSISVEGTFCPKTDEEKTQTAKAIEVKKNLNELCIRRILYLAAFALACPGKAIGGGLQKNIFLHIYIEFLGNKQIIEYNKDRKLIEIFFTGMPTRN